MSYIFKYQGGEPCQPGDVVMFKKKTTEVYTGREKKVVPLTGEVVKPSQFTIFPPNMLCVVIHQESKYGFTCFGTENLPRSNGGYTFVAPEDLKFMHRVRKGMSVFDAPPREDTKHRSRR